MADVSLGYVYEFGAGEEFVALAGEARRSTARRRGARKGMGSRNAVEASKPERVRTASEALAGLAYRIRAPARSRSRPATSRQAASTACSPRATAARWTPPPRSSSCARRAALSFGGERPSRRWPWTPATGSPPPATDADLRLLLEAQDRVPVSEPSPPQEGDPRMAGLGAGRALALALAGDGPRWLGTADELRLPIRAPRAPFAATRACAPPGPGCLAAELVGHDEWARTNLASFREMSGEVERALAGRMQESGSSGRIGQSIARAATGVEVGLTLGYLAQKVVGQYDVALIGLDPRAAAAVRGAEPVLGKQRLEVDREPSSAGSPCTRPRTQCSSPRCLG